MRVCVTTNKILFLHNLETQKETIKTNNTPVATATLMLNISEMLELLFLPTLDFQWGIFFFFCHLCLFFTLMMWQIFSKD